MAHWRQPYYTLGVVLGAQIVELFVIMGWVSVTMGPLFYVFHKLRILRRLDNAYVGSKETHVGFQGDYTPIKDEQC